MHTEVGCRFHTNISSVQIHSGPQISLEIRAHVGVDNLIKQKGLKIIELIHLQSEYKKIKTVDIENRDLMSWVFMEEISLEVRHGDI